MNIKKYFSLAKNASKLSDYTKKNIHIGAVIVYKNKIISNGWNTTKTNPIQLKYNRYREMSIDNRDNRTYNADSHLPTLHAEMMALVNARNIDIDWNKASIYIYRESNGIKRNCRPCPSCMRALKDKGVHNIFYTNEEGYNCEII